MYAERLMIETDSLGNPCQLLQLQPNAKLEVIVLVLEKTQLPIRRQPPPSIAGKGEILGDIVSPVVAETDWDVLR